LQQPFWPYFEVLKSVNGTNLPAGKTRVQKIPGAIMGVVLAALVAYFLGATNAIGFAV
jgi:uncharacterized membrane protein YgaE (UPF0421/DUF939 family)